MDEVPNVLASDNPFMSEAPPASQPTPLPVEVRTCPSVPCAPPTVKLSVSNVPSTSTSPEISKLVKTEVPAAVTMPVAVKSTTLRLAKASTNAAPAPAPSE
jgi:hypothetical protein